MSGYEPVPQADDGKDGHPPMTQEDLRSSRLAAFSSFRTSAASAYSAIVRQVGLASPLPPSRAAGAEGFDSLGEAAGVSHDGEDESEASASGIELSELQLLPKPRSATAHLPSWTVARSGRAGAPPQPLPMQGGPGQGQGQLGRGGGGGALGGPLFGVGVGASADDEDDVDAAAVEVPHGYAFVRPRSTSTSTSPSRRSGGGSGAADPDREAGGSEAHGGAGHVAARAGGEGAPPHGPPPPLSAIGGLARAIAAADAIDAGLPASRRAAGAPPGESKRPDGSDDRGAGQGPGQGQGQGQRGGDGDGELGLGQGGIGAQPGVVRINGRLVRAGRNGRNEVYDEEAGVWRAGGDAAGGNDDDADEGKGGEVLIITLSDLPPRAYLAALASHFMIGFMLGSLTDSLWFFMMVSIRHRPEAVPMALGITLGVFVQVVARVHLIGRERKGRAIGSIVVPGTNMTLPWTPALDKFPPLVR